MSGKAHRGRKWDRLTRQRTVDVHPTVVVDERDQLTGDDPQAAHDAPRPAAGLTHPDPGSGGNRHDPHDTPDNGQ